MADDSTISTRQPNEPFGIVKQNKFIEAYRQSSNIRASCEYAKIHRSTYYNYTDPGHELYNAEFAARVKIAEQEAVDRLEAKAWHEALAGNSVTDRWNLLKAHRPEKYREPVQRIAQTDSEGNDLPNV